MDKEQCELFDLENEIDLELLPNGGDNDLTTSAPINNSFCGEPMTRWNVSYGFAVDNTTFCNDWNLEGHNTSDESCESSTFASFRASSTSPMPSIARNSSLQCDSPIDDMFLDDDFASFSLWMADCNFLDEKQPSPHLNARKAASVDVLPCALSIEDAQFQTLLSMPISTPLNDIDDDGNNNKSHKRKQPYMKKSYRVKQEEGNQFLGSVPSTEGALCPALSKRPKPSDTHTTPQGLTEGQIRFRESMRRETEEQRRQRRIRDAARHRIAYAKKKLEKTEKKMESIGAGISS